MSISIWYIYIYIYRICIFIVISYIYLKGQLRCLWYAEDVLGYQHIPNEVASKSMNIQISVLKIGGSIGAGFNYIKTISCFGMKWYGHRRAIETLTLHDTWSGTEGWILMIPPKSLKGFISTEWGFPSSAVPRIHHPLKEWRIFPYELSILRYPHWWNPHLLFEGHVANISPLQVTCLSKMPGPEFFGLKMGRTPNSQLTSTIILVELVQRSEPKSSVLILAYTNILSPWIPSGKLT